MKARLTTLPNGFRVASDHMPGLRSSALAIYVLAGSRNEREDQNGVAHFLEHMAFKGTKTRSAIQIAQSIEDVGGFLNAYTSQDRTAYFIRILEEDVPFGIELLADILLNSVYNSGEMEKERNVILNEIRQYKDYPEEMVFEGLQRTIYPHQPLGRPILGSSKLVGSYQRNNLLEFVDQYYRPQNMILAAAGAVNHEAMVEMAEKYFGHLQQEPCESYVRGNYQNGEYREEKDIEQVQMVLACESPPINHDLEAATNIYTRILGGGSSSRLFVEAREKRGLCYSISAQVNSQPDTGLFVVHSSTGENEIEELCYCCAREIARLQNDIEEAEVKRAKAQIKSAILMGFENPSNRVERMGFMLHHFGKILTIDETIEKYENVTVDKVQESSHYLLAGQEFSLALFGRINNAPSRKDIIGKLKL